MLTVIKYLLSLIFKPASSTLTVHSASAEEVLLEEAKRWLGTKEIGENSGPAVEEFQRAVDGKAVKESWCAAFVMFCINQVEQKLGIKSRVYKSELCTNVWAKSPPELRLTTPKPGCLVIWQKRLSILGHIGIVVKIEDHWLHTIEGNTAPDGYGIQRDGDGVYYKIHDLNTPTNMTLLGYLRVF